MKPALVRRLALGSLVLLACTLSAALRAETLPRESWLGIYFNGKKIGYSSLHTERSTYRDSPALKITSKSVTHIELFGNSVSQDVTFTLFTDSSYTPLHQDYHISSNGSAMDLTADYQPGKILCALKSGGGTTIREVPVPKGAKLTGDTTVMQSVPVGHKDTFYYLNPVTVSLEKLDLDVRAKETVKLAGKSYEALRIVASTPMGEMTSWETQDGDVLKGELPLGMAMYTESSEVAQNLASSPPAFQIAGGAPEPVKSAYLPSDLAVATAISVDKPIQKPRQLKSLSVEVTGISDQSHILSDNRQRGGPVASKPGAYRITVTAATFDADNAPALPVKDARGVPYLKRAAFLETDDPQIQAIAHKLRAGNNNSYKVALAIHNWVHDTMKPDYTIAVPQSCVALYHNPKGVCRDYATLFAGVARAAGIPTRVVAGIVYAEGRFFYHAWDECWLGKWVPFDATMPGAFVDATHIKFSQGEVTEMYNVAGVVGRIKLKVLAAK